jgi:UDP-galactopyranose mutase
MAKYDYLIVGAGLFGSVFAQLMQEKGKKCLAIDKRGNPGGNIYCKEEDGIRIHAYGAHIFHTDVESVWRYANRFVRFNHYINSPLANYKGKLYNLPFNMNTFNRLWNVNTPEEARRKLEEQCRPYQGVAEPANLEEQALKLCGDDIYYTFIKEYTEKQWGLPATRLPAFIIKRIPFRFVYDNNYFNDPYQGVPAEGYNALIDRLLEGVELRLETNYFGNRDYFDRLASKVLFTGCIDEFFGYRFGKLQYRSLRFEHERLETDNYQGNAVVNYNEARIPFTRIIEHKHFEFGTQPFTVVTREYPQPHTAGAEPYYPVNNDENMRLLSRYKELAASLRPDVLFGGRLAQYAYFDMDDTIAAAMKLAESEEIRAK